MESEPRTVVKVEVNPVIRGTLLPVRELDLCEAAQEAFGRFVVAHVVGEGELLGGKLVAALDRQHPRDLFDARFILDRVDGQPDDDLRLGFLLMLLSHNRPPQVVGRGARPARAGPVRRVCPPVRRHGPRAVRPQ